jgi:diguanylate cyclase (GGDEF)-like protein
MPPGEVLVQAVVMIVIAGVIAGAIQSLQASRVISAGFVIITLIPLISWLLLQPSKAYKLLTIAIFFFLLFCLVLSIKGYQLIVEVLQLHHDKFHLIQDLQSAKRKLETTNQSLLNEVQVRRRAEDELVFLAKHDSLTGFYNRSNLEEMFAQALGRAKRHQKKMAILFIDLDGFKEINDTHGHAMGDQVLMHVADKIKRNIRASDPITRLGGDEFVIILEDIIGGHAVLAVAEKLRLILGQPFQLHGQVCNITASIGVSIYPDHGEQAEELLQKADAAMYLAKQIGKNQCVLAN